MYQLYQLNSMYYIADIESGIRSFVSTSISGAVNSFVSDYHRLTKVTKEFPANKILLGTASAPSDFTPTNFPELFI